MSFLTSLPIPIQLPLTKMKKHKSCAPNIEPNDEMRKPRANPNPR